MYGITMRKLARMSLSFWHLISWIKIQHEIVWYYELRIEGFMKQMYLGHTGTLVNISIINSYTEIIYSCISSIRNGHMYKGFVSLTIAEPEMPVETDMIYQRKVIQTQKISGHQYFKWTYVQWKGKIVTATALLHLPKTEGESPQPAAT